LIHELIHAYHDLQQKNYHQLLDVSEQIMLLFDSPEEFATIAGFPEDPFTENGFRREMGLAPRISHGGVSKRLVPEFDGAQTLPAEEDQITPRDLFRLSVYHGTKMAPDTVLATGFTSAYESDYDYVPAAEKIAKDKERLVRFQNNDLLSYYS
jgi:hypothetical protein